MFFKEPHQIELSHGLTALTYVYVLDFGAIARTQHARSDSGEEKLTFNKKKSKVIILNTFIISYQQQHIMPSINL